MRKFRLVSISICLLVLLVLCCPSCNKPFEVRGQIKAESSSPSYYTIYDYNEPDKIVLVKGEGINVDDEYLSTDNKLYRIVSVDNKTKTGKAEFVCDEKLPKYNVTRRNENKVVAQTKKKVGLYHTHNDESYLDADGTDSVYGKGGIHDIAPVVALAVGNARPD